MAAAVQLALSTYVSYLGQQVFYSDWLKVSPPAVPAAPPALLLLLNVSSSSSSSSFPRPPPGEDVLQGAGCGRGLPGSGQRCRRGLQTEGPQQVPAVHRTSLAGSLPHLHGETLSCTLSSIHHPLINQSINPVMNPSIINNLSIHPSINQSIQPSIIRSINFTHSQAPPPCFLHNAAPCDVKEGRSWKSLVEGADCCPPVACRCTPCSTARRSGRPTSTTSWVEK